MDPFGTPIVEPLMGVPIGGIGCGSIGRGWRGDFIRWNICPCGIFSSSPVEVNQFSVNISKKDQPPKATVLYPGRPTKNPKLASDWEWQVTGDKSTYYALFPRSWTVYEEPEPSISMIIILCSLYYLDIRLICRQISPVIPHNYKESSYPCGVFVWTIENTGDTEADVSSILPFLRNGLVTH
jgi:non-lysosomal glucosylceramidase